MKPEEQELAKCGSDLAAARERQDDALRALATAVMAAVEAGTSEVRAASLAGVNRLTIRRMLGKPRVAGSGTQQIVIEP